ncbi:hypothetical protein A3J33_00120 [candidate division WWE3 bacterium RIFCSPLOWO2_02_FULL_53_10]|uniref:Four helix bundle protein n=2 Tax=Katanobacteria TaxID=422282 RepID=A0A1F4WQE7_UNCKA|nr:MAG: hypothetical protein A2890_00010 [candidate division WWE3 bacterium RIFCSPLOWO2_01_FULL_53_14]OGC71616.1 MAG: hypothetical protein A3J33_00120 [candidate division WWE3 bacterium RIFCSPLOWO2_02_FULL_53_10]
MAKQDFTSLEIWKKAHELTLRSYKLTQGFPKEEIYGLTSQLRRAAVSVEANIAEGYERYHPADQSKFFVDARASCAECQTLLLIVRDLKYPATEESNSLVEEYQTLAKRINALLSYRRSKNA